MRKGTLAMLRERASVSPSRSTPGLALAASRDASGSVWLHALLVSEPELDDDARARLIARLVLQLAWLPSAAPRLRPLAPGLVLAAELAERESSELAIHVRFAEAFELAVAAPHLPCFVQLGCGVLEPVTLALDPVSSSALPELEVGLGTSPGDALLRAELARGDLAARLAARLGALEAALQAPTLRERVLDGPLREAIVVACELADAGHETLRLRAQALAWAHELLDRLATHRHALAVRLRHASGSSGALLQARLRLHEQTWRALTGGDERLAGLFATADGRSLLARRLPT